MKGAPILGVLTGAVADVVSSFLLGIPFAIYALSKIDVAHTPKEQLGHAMATVVHANTALYLAQLFVGLACSVFGGFVAALIARRMELLIGALSSFLSVGLWISVLIAGDHIEPVSAQILQLIASPIMGLLGGYLRLRQTRTAPRAGASS